jgi:hypothetical protein
MLLRSGFYRACEFVGRASAIISIVSMASFLLVATAADLMFAFEG